MKIAILGVGNIGGTLGRKWAAAGHQVTFGVRQPASNKTQALLETMPGTVSADTVAGAIPAGDVVLFAIPWDAVASTARAHAAALQDKVLIDATNNFGAPVVNNLDTLIQQAPSAAVYRAFNALGWENFEQPRFDLGPADLFYTGPDGEHRDAVQTLITDVGLRPIWVGDNDRAPLVDNLGELWVQLAFRQGMGRRFAFKLMTA
jgi:hypothetical protein